MMEKNSFWRKTLAFVLSLLVIVMVLPTTFSAPLEFIILRNETYSNLLKSEETLTTGQEAFSAIISDQLNQPSDNEVVPAIFSDTDMIAEIIKPYITKEWVQSSLTSGMNQLLDFLNFKQPFGIINIDLTELKQNVLVDKETLAESILSHFATCDAKDIQTLTAGIDSPADLPACNPPQELKAGIVEAIAAYIEGFLYRIPNQYEINVEELVQAGTSDPLLSYSMFRWIFRLLPVAVAALLILLVICLRKNKKEMRSWVGKLLIISAVVSLIVILVLLIGSEQFTTVLVNNVLSADQEAFGTLILRLLQSITYRSLLWMAASAGIILVIGLIIFFLNKISRIEKRETVDQDAFLEEPAEDILEAKREMIEGVSEEEEQE